MSVRAKFKLIKVSMQGSSKPVNNPDGTAKKDERGYTVTEPCVLTTLEFCPVYGNGNAKHENTKFWQSSPSGNITLGCVNEEASKQFKLEKEYYIDFTESE